jgi:transposase
MKQERWTKEATDRLLRLIRTMEWREAAHILRRTPGSVQGHINWLRARGAVFPSRVSSGGANEKRLSEEQVAWLRAHVATTSREQIAAHLGISSTTLFRKLKKLNLSQIRHRQRPWSESEDAQLRSLVGTCSAEEIAARIGRTRHGVLWRAVQLGLSLRIQLKWMPGELAELRRLIGEGHTSAEIAVHLGKAARSVRRKASTLGLRLMGRSRPRGARKPPTERRLPSVATAVDSAPRERKGIYQPRPRRVVYKGTLAWCEKCCAPVVDSPKGWAEHNARVHVAPRRVA